ncbi:MAG: phospholipase, partial [Ignavibacteriales bacterium]|nr:phospholipase [Ignavibacteriales bacterium]
METIATTLYHRTALPHSPAGDRHPAIIFLHGRGADENDLFGLAPYFDPRLFIISV